MTVDKARSWAPGDPCPACGGTLAPHRAPTDAEYAASVDRENQKVLPARVDSASPSFIAEHGTLHVCDACGYKSRADVAPDPAPAADDKPAAARPRAARPSNAE